MSDIQKADEIKDIRKKIQNFHTILNKEPVGTKTNAYANNTKYLPISFLEMKLDEMFFGLWQTKEFKTQVIANEIIGSLELSYYHPVSMTWIIRAGAAGVLIRQSSGADITDISKKIKNALVMDYPHLKAQCFRNACLSIGKSFGRDLNREYEDTYTPVIKDTTKEDELKQKIIDGLDIYQGEDKSELQEMCADKVRANEFTKDFAEEVAKTIGITL